MIEIHKAKLCINHSIFLNNYFNISKSGVDYYNQFNISFEFKETYGIRFERFRISKKQLYESNYIVFSIQGKEFYIQIIFFLNILLKIICVILIHQL